MPKPHRDISDHRRQEIINHVGKHGIADACEYFGLQEDTIRRYMRGLPISGDTHMSREEDADGVLQYVVTSSDIRTLEELVAYCKIDLTKYKVVKFRCGAWGSAGNANFQTRGTFAPILDTVDIAQLIEDFRAEAAAHAPAYKKIRYSKKETGNMFEVGVPDLHHGQLSWGKETGNKNYDIKISEKLFLSAVDHLAYHAQRYEPEQIVFPIGNDFFNVNSRLKTTAAGTPQDEDCRYQKSFMTGLKMVVTAVDRLALTAPVIVVIVPGNHDLERAFYLGAALECWYRNHATVTVDNSPTFRKYIRWGKGLLGLTHGCDIKVQKLPLLMATEKPRMWADSLYREWHIGHLHHQQVQAWKPSQEENGVRVRILSSLVAPSAWAAQHGYDSLCEAQGFIWNKAKGVEASFAYHPS